MSESNFVSYPPLFRPPNTPVEGFDFDFDFDEPTKQTPDTTDPLPVIDLQFIDHDKLGEACKDWGVFRLVNHGIPVTLLNQLHEHAKKLFYLSFESKQALFTNPIAYFWGTPALTLSGAALQKGRQTQHVNWMEGFNVPLRQLSHLQLEDPVLDSFGLLLEEYGRHQSRVATTIFEAMAENLKLGVKQSESYLSPSTGVARVYRYPCCTEPNRAWGMDIHTDSSVISILNQDEVGGLQFHKNDKWLDVQPIPNTLVINLGDIMQAISDDEYKSVKHRVKVNKHEERISIGYFVFPEEDFVIQSSKYKPFTNADFRAQVQQDLRTLGFKVGLERFKLT